MKSFIKKADFFTVNPVDQLHFDDSKDNKTIFGGICSILLIIVFIIFAIIQAIPILKGEKTYHSQITKKLDEAFEITTTDAFSLYLAILKNLSPIKMDYTKLDIYIFQNKTKRRYEVKLCNQSDLQGYEMDYYLNQYVKAGLPLYCIDDPSKTLKTTTKEGFEFMIERCSNDTSKNITCSSDEEIDSYLENADVNICILDDKLDSQSFTEKPVYRKSHWLPPIILYQKVSYTWGQFYYRYNTFHRTDTYYGVKSEPFHFVDFVFGICEQYSIIQSNFIARIEVANYSDKVENKRIIQNVFDWISKIAGVPHLLYICFRLIMVKYQTFNSNMQIAQKLKFIKEESYQQFKSHYYSSFLNRIFKCCLKSKSKEKDKRLSKKLERVENKVKQQFDFKQIIMNINIILRKLKLGNSNSSNEMSIFNL